jgi:hypothetical protein
MEKTQVKGETDDFFDLIQRTQVALYPHWHATACDDEIQWTGTLAEWWQANTLFNLEQVRVMIGNLYHDRSHLIGGGSEAKFQMVRVAGVKHAVLGTVSAVDVATGEQTPVEIGVVKCSDHGYTQDELQAAFDKVKPDSHWKDPINATIRASDRDVVEAAIIHFTATEPKFTVEGAYTLRVRAAGYRAGPAGDH